MNLQTDDAVRDAQRKRRALRLMAGAAGGIVLIVAGLGAYFASGPQMAMPSGDSKSLPEIRFQDGNGKAMTLVDFRGRVVLLNLWATWCVPCRKEMPALDRLQARLGSADFEVVALSIDRDPRLIQQFYREYGIQSLALYIDSSAEAPNKLGAIGIPTTLLVDRDGHEVWRLTGPAEWDAPSSVEAIRKALIERKRN